jgi:hypothetical protein
LTRKYRKHLEIPKSKTFPKLSLSLSLPSLIYYVVFSFLTMSVTMVLNCSGCVKGENILSLVQMFGIEFSKIASIYEFPYGMQCWMELCYWFTGLTVSVWGLIFDQTRIFFKDSFQFLFRVWSVPWHINKSVNSTISTWQSAMQIVSWCNVDSDTEEMLHSIKAAYQSCLLKSAVHWNNKCIEQIQTQGEDLTRGIGILL